MTDQTKLLTENLHLICMAVDHFLWHYGPETEEEYLTQKEMEAFQRELERTIDGET